MTAFGVVVFEVAACLGLGAAVLRGFGLLRELPAAERIAWSFAVGFGALGWFLFFVGTAGLFQIGPLALVLAVAACGMAFLYPLDLAPRLPRGVVEWALCIVLLVVLGCDLLEGLSPPADADTLAYHFALPKDYLSAGRLTFVPRAGDGTQPMLIQLSYLPVLALGGERALTLWTMASAWAVGALFYVALRHFVATHWALATTLIFLTTPAVLYGAGSGQIDVRSTLFAMMVAAAIYRARGSDGFAWIAFAGLCAGFMAGTKYYGLIFVASAGLVVLASRRWRANALIFGTMALIGGAQWYAWNWIHVGDPFYPLLVAKLGIGATDIWPADFYTWFKYGAIDLNVAVPANPVWWLLYPISATFSGYPAFESDRTGLGLFMVLALPFAVLGAWRARAQLLRHPLMPGLCIAVIFYTMWFFSGTAQRVRFLMPIYPLILMALAVAATRYAEAARKVILLASAILIVLGIQLAGDGLFTLNYARHVLTGESRNAFLARNIAGYGAVEWINENLTQMDRVFTLERQTIYLYEVPVHYGHIYEDPTVDLRPGASTERSVQRLRTLGITHILLASMSMDTYFGNRLGCFDLMKSFSSTVIASRTLNQTGAAPDLHLYRFRPDCPIAPAAS